MRLTVGPLSPAVYWRRRAVVLGAVLLFLVVLVYSCSQPGRQTGKPGASATTLGPTPTGANGTGSPAATGSPRAGTPSAGGSVGSGDDGAGGGPAGQQTPAPGATGEVNATGVAAPPPGGCTDDEISVVPVATPGTAQSGTVVNLKIKIKNTSSRTCPRDVGADLQEIYIKSGARRVWSSDTCGTARGSDVQSFTPGFERSYEVNWNGREATGCADGEATGSPVDAGTYQVIGRLGSKLSQPVKLTITGGVSAGS